MRFERSNDAAGRFEPLAGWNETPDFNPLVVQRQASRKHQPTMARCTIAIAIAIELVSTIAMTGQ